MSNNGILTIQSDQVTRFVPRRTSQPSTSAWALEALVMVSRDPLNGTWYCFSQLFIVSDPAIQKGLAYLLKNYDHGWKDTYPTMSGFAGVSSTLTILTTQKLYLLYHNYADLWPTTTLLRYVNHPMVKAQL